MVRELLNGYSMHTVQTCGSIDALLTEKCDLQEFLSPANIELSIDWFDLLQKTVYRHDHSVRYYYVAERERPLVILPLRFTTKGRARVVESLTNYYTSLYRPLVGNDSDNLEKHLKDLLSAAARDHQSAHVMRFAPMDPNDPLYWRLMSDLRTIGWIPFRFGCFGNWFLTISFDWAGYLKSRSANLRSTLKRMSRRFAAAGGRLEVVSSPEGIEQTIAAYQEVYSMSWKKPEPHPDFIPSLIRLLASRGTLRMGIARLNDKPIAAQLWIADQGKASIYKVAYNEEFSEYSPGTILTSHLMQHVIEHDRVAEVDFLIGDDKYKKIWMSDRRERWGIVAYNPRKTIGVVLLSKEVFGRLTKPARKKVKQWSQAISEKYRSTFPIRSHL